eukprot:1156916-Pelagomonas_calceolata.AAC.10
MMRAQPELHAHHNDTGWGVSPAKLGMFGDAHSCCANQLLYVWIVMRRLGASPQQGWEHQPSKVGHVWSEMLAPAVGGITPAELNMLEMEMLKLLDFRLLVDVDDLHRRLVLLEQGKLALCKEAPEASGMPVCYGV